MLPLPVTNNSNCGNFITVDEVNAGELRKLCMQVVDKEGCAVNILEATGIRVCPYSPTSSSSSSSTSNSSSSSVSSSNSSSSYSFDPAFSSSSSSTSSSSLSTSFGFSSSSPSFSSSSSLSSSSLSSSSSRSSSESSSSADADSSSSSSSSSTSNSSSSSSTVAAADLPEGWIAVYRAKQLYSTGKLFSYLMTVDDATKGAFHVTIAPTDLKKPGVYLGEIAIYDDDNNLRFTDARYLKVNPTLEYNHYGPVMPSDVRMALWDYCPEDNTLLDDYEFPEEEIIYMIRRPLDLWNELSPGGIHIATPSNFPWRENWLRCTVGYLLLAAGRRQRRNYLQYTASGLSVNDNANWNHYMQEGEGLISQFKDWAQNKKVELNISGGYGTLGSSY